MKYYKSYYKGDGAEPMEISKDEARRTLEGYWKDETLDDVFTNEKQFCLCTPYADVWTKSENGMMPMPGFYGICG